MTERELKLLLDANAVKRVQVHYAVMADGYMVVVDGKTLDAAARFLFKTGVAEFAVKLRTA